MGAMLSSKDIENNYILFCYIDIFSFRIISST